MFHGLKRLDLTHDGPSVRLCQFTDCHLGAELGGRLLGMDTDHSMLAVVEQARRDGRSADLVLATGDLADGGAPAAYRRLQSALAAFCPRQFWLPGNHDDCAAMQAVPGSERIMSGDIRVGAWQIILLNSQVPGEIGGEIGPMQLRALDEALSGASEAGLHSLICLHHQPVAIGCAWLDEQMVADADALFAITDRYPGVKALLWGHIHQEVDRQRGSVRLLASPSTCVQFAPGSEDFQADDLPPGYRWLELHGDGRIDTGVSRVEGVTFEINLQQRGYL
ncbi:3',5'-cyclic-AMP phosphodiesterase [Parahaliea maris]|uniref:3',5'-cyclic-AMP phosphodiesterase n=1 Tax=Parahaliea maris TaxID=2716870 RepID=A0A5C9A215_9GAMM|nr:3',5'-cyclic-AMP phosphodiesterase [Parahaliea maris]TXS93820.1 3',5'-cyclic-AMP phosphodiesterase [Parahaliea maris]